MILGSVNSINQVPIRLTEERWEHIVDEHPELSSYVDDILAAVADPEYILRGQGGTLIGVLNLGRRTFLHVIYREVSKDDGFIITAFLKPSVNKQTIVWRADDQ